MLWEIQMQKKKKTKLKHTGKTISHVSYIISPNT